MTSSIHPDRRKKLDALRELGVNPYANRYEAPRPIADVLREFAKKNPQAAPAEGDEAAAAPAESVRVEGVRVAGRVMALRDHGKSIFLELKDRTGRMQVYLRKNDIGDEAFEKLGLVDLGDFLGADGDVDKTRKGEITIFATGFTFLSKALQPIPEKWHGLRDVETRYRKRYVDLFANDEVAEAFRVRAMIIRRLRRFLDDQGFTEVETPMMHPIAGGAAARPFVTHHNTLDMQLYLRIAPELYLKRLLVGGMERVYEINRNFRNEGISTRHNPEYTMLEAYCAYADYNDLMDLVERMIVDAAEPMFGEEPKIPTPDGRTLDLSRPWRRAKYRDLFQEATGVDMNDRDAVVAYAKSIGIDVEGDRDFHAIANDVFEEKVEPDLFEPTFVYDYPVEISPLSKCREDDPSTAERFELFIRNMEMVNAFSELNDPIDQEERFRRQVDSKDEEAPAEVDYDYVTALEHGMPPAAGLGLGVDRLAMIFTNAQSIRDVILFPLLRHQASGGEPDAGSESDANEE